MKDSELRIWVACRGGVYRLFSWKAFFEHVRHALDGAHGAAQQFVERGLNRWEAEERSMWLKRRLYESRPHLRRLVMHCAIWARI